VIFQMVRIMNKARNLGIKRDEAAAAAVPPPPPPEDIVLLREIRDSLKK
jgi:large conductance mechanosensitive channel